MSESRLVPCNLMAWPRVRDLLPDQKLLVYHLWATCQQASGCQLLDLASFQGALSITSPAIQQALDEFQRRGLIDQDLQTGEVFILDWYRFHKFDSPARRRVAEDSIRRIQSPRLKSIVEESSTYVLREGKVREGKGREDKASNPQERAEGQRPSGKRASGPLSEGDVRTGKYLTDPETKICLQTGNAADLQVLAEIKQHHPHEIAGAVAIAISGEPSGRAYPTAVLRSLRRGGRAGSGSGTSAGAQAPAWARAGARAQARPAQEIDITAQGEVL